MRLAELALSADPPITGLGLYHGQQAAEKALKGFLVLHGVAYPLTHNLSELLRLAEEAEPGLGEELLEVVDLTSFATRYRYPGDPVVPEVEEGRFHLAVARRAYDVIRRRVP